MEVILITTGALAMLSFAFLLLILRLTRKRNDTEIQEGATSQDT